MIRAKLHKIKQELDHTRIDNIRQHIHDEFQKQNLTTVIGKGDRVAIAVGSRGINQIDEIVKSVVDEVQRGRRRDRLSFLPWGPMAVLLPKGRRRYWKTTGFLKRKVNALHRIFNGDGPPGGNKERHSRLH